MAEADEPGDAGENGTRRGGKRASAFRTIGEVAEELDLPAHVLRFWESKFPQLRPLKRGGGRRYYRPEDIALLRRIRQCLYQDGYTIRGVQKLLNDGDAEPDAADDPTPSGATTLFPLDTMPEPEPAVTVTRSPPPPPALSAEARAALEEARRELVEIRALLDRLLRRQL